jgi:hypothetical protein
LFLAAFVRKRGEAGGEKNLLKFQTGTGVPFNLPNSMSGVPLENFLFGYQWPAISRLGSPNNSKSVQT